MKKITFSVMLALAALGFNAQEAHADGWSDKLATTEKASDLLRCGAMAIDAEGNSIVTGRYDKALSFASSYLEPVAKSAFVAKYDNKGGRKWAAGLSGAATITTVATDAEGNVYAAGTFADVVNILDGTGATKQTITGMADYTTEVSGFIVKYDKDGNYVSSKTIIPEVDMVNDDYWLPDPAFTPGKIEISGDRVLLSASYKTKCQIDNLTLRGQYCHLDWGYMFDVATLGVFSLSKNLDDAALVLQLAATDNETAIGYGAEDVCFATDSTKTYVGFVAYGDNLTMKSANDTKQITDLISAVDGEEITYEHAYILATVENGSVSSTATFHSKASGDAAKYNTIDAMQIKNGNIYLAGTFNEAFPFDTTKTYVGGSDMYIACVNASDLSLNWAQNSGYNDGESTKKAEVVSSLDLNISPKGWALAMGWVESKSDHAVYMPLVFGANGTEKEINEYDDDCIMNVVTTAQSALYQYDNVTDDSDKDDAAEGVYTYKYNAIDKSGIDQATTNGNAISVKGDAIVLANAADVNVYNASGALVKSAKRATSVALGNLASGVYVVKAGGQTVKIVK